MLFLRVRVQSLYPRECSFFLELFLVPLEDLRLVSLLACP